MAAFDFDGTLTYHDTFLPWLWTLVGPLRFIAGMLRCLPWLLAYKLGLLANDRAKVKVLKTLVRGRLLSELTASGRAFADLIPARLRPDMLARLRWHQEKGHTCVLVSASLELYLVDWALQNGFAAVLATRLELDEDGRATGQLAGANCYGVEKGRRLWAWLEHTRPAKLYAYGDTRGDREMLHLADEAWYRGKPRA